MNDVAVNSVGRRSRPQVMRRVIRQRARTSEAPMGRGLQTPKPPNAAGTLGAWLPPRSLTVVQNQVQKAICGTEPSLQILCRHGTYVPLFVALLSNRENIMT